MTIQELKKELKPLIKKAQRKRLAILKSGLRSEAFDRAMSALNDNGFWSPKKTASLGELVRYKHILEKFLSSKTSTPSGILKANKAKREGFGKYMRLTFGFEGNTDELYNMLGGLDVSALIKASGYNCAAFFNEMAISAEDGMLNQFISDMISNLPFDGSGITDGGEWFESDDYAEFLFNDKGVPVL